MKQAKKKSWGLIVLIMVLAAAVVIAAVILIVTQVRKNRYNSYMSEGSSYMDSQDYTKAIEAYRSAIKMNPDDDTAYLKLVELYVRTGKYSSAQTYAEQGYSSTRNNRLKDLKDQIILLREDGDTTDEEVYEWVQDEANGDTSITYNGKSLQAAEDTSLNSSTESVVITAPSGTSATTGEGVDDSSLTIRYVMLDHFTDMCYQEYVNSYGKASTEQVSDQEGWILRFAGLNADVYYRNTQEYFNIIDPLTRVPQQAAIPYRIRITSPGQLFLNYSGYISAERLQEMFQTNAKASFDESLNAYVLRVTYAGANVLIYTDENGNLTGDNPRIDIYNTKVMKAGWVDEEDKETFRLGSREYTYDVRSIDLRNEPEILDLTPLAKCELLEELILVNCRIDSLQPLSDCRELTYLVLQGSLGFSDLTPISGLPWLVYVNLHMCEDVDTIVPIMDMELKELDLCFSGVPKSEAIEYYRRHPNCLVWFDNVRLDENDVEAAGEEYQGDGMGTGTALPDEDDGDDEG